MNNDPARFLLILLLFLHITMRNRLGSISVNKRNACFMNGKNLLLFVCVSMIINFHRFFNGV